LSDIELVKIKTEQLLQRQKSEQWIVAWLTATSTAERR